jgi:hypothetical protein
MLYWNTLRIYLLIKMPGWLCLALGSDWLSFVFIIYNQAPRLPWGVREACRQHVELVFAASLGPEATKEQPT